MKRIDHTVAGGRPKERGRSGFVRREGAVDVAGMPASTGTSSGTSPGWSDVASFRHAFARHGFGYSYSLGRVLEDPTAAFAEDAMLLEDFADFLSEGAEVDGEHDSFVPQAMLQADPEFRERLRGRLWRTFVQTHLRDGGGRH